MKADGIIFDVDGTLWDATEQICEAYNEVIAKDGRLRKTLARCDMERVMGLTLQEIADVLFSELGTKEREQLLKDCCSYECAYLRKNGGELYPEVKKTLEKLAKSYPLYIVSNCQDGYIEAMFSLHAIEAFFQDWECCGRTGCSKEENLRLLIERNHLCSPVYIGDTKKDEIACKKAGIPFIYASYGFGEAQSYLAKIDHFSQLAKLFEADDV